MTNEQQLATAILAAAKAHEDSYDTHAADAATARERASHAGTGILDSSMWVDYAQFYTKTLRQACEEVSGPMSEPVYLLLYYSPNDAQDWAMEVLGIQNHAGDGVESHV